MSVSEPPLILRRSPCLALSPPPHQPNRSRSGERTTPKPHNHTTDQALALSSWHEPLEEEAAPQPLKICHPTKSPTPQKLHLLDASSSSAKKAPRRSLRLMGASVRVANGRCGSALLLNLPEKKAYQLARECLDDSDLSLKCLRSRNLRPPSHSASLSPPHGKRKRDSGQSSEEIPANWNAVRRSPRFSGEEAVGTSALKELVYETEGKLALPSLSMADSLRKSKELDFPRHSEQTSVSRDFPRRSQRFSGEKAGDSSAFKGLVDENEGKLKAKTGDVCLALPSSSRFSVEKAGDSLALKGLVDENEGELKRKSGVVCLALPCSSMAGNLGKSRSRDSRRHFDEMSVNRDFQRLSPRFSCEKASEPLQLTESVDATEWKSVRKSEDALLALPSSSLAEKPGKFRKLDSRKDLGFPKKTPANAEFLRHSPSFSSEAVKASTGKELIDEDEGKLVRKAEIIILGLPSSSMAAEFGKSQRLSPRFSVAKAVESPACSELINDTGARPEDAPRLLSMSSVMEEIFGKIEEEKVLRRSPRGLSSICLVDDYESAEMKELALPSLKKKKKKEQEKAPKERRENSKVSGSSSPSSIDREELPRSKKSCFFVGEAVPEQEARQRWGWRYELKNRRSKGRSLTANVDEEDEPILEVQCHYTEAQINGCTFHLGDCALIRGEEGQEHIGRLIEFFHTMEGEDYFRVQWFYRAEDTVLKDAASFHDKKRVFYSTIMNDNLLDCILSKLNVARVTPELTLKTGSIPPSDFYYDMEYCLDYSTFRNLPRDNSVKGSELSSIRCPEPVLTVSETCLLGNISICESCNAELTMLDIYAGCGAMSTGLRIGAKLSGVNLLTRWAIDSDSWACASLRLNHPETQIKTEAAEDFLELLKHWEKLCKKFVTEDVETCFPSSEEVSGAAELNSDAESGNDISDEELEVLSLVDIRYGDANESGKRGLEFKVHWKGYDASADTWEPIEGLSNCQELIQEFVINGFKNKILPLPGDVDVICGGPPCQGISGYNRFRCIDNPLSDEKNQQLVVFMDIVEYLKPKFVLMENVTDILRFDKGSLGRYALSRLVHMNYQARVGIMAAGCYGLPQFRLRVFFWGALPSEELPQFPLPTHDVVVRYWPPPEFERNVVAYDEGQPPELEDAVLLSDAISDLPAVTNYESSDEMPHNKPPETEFQKYIRSINHEMIGSDTRAEEAVLYDHRPHQLFEDDYVRVCQIPQRKGANFRDLPGLVVGDDNVVRRDPTTKPVLLPSGRPMVPEYVFTFEHGKSKRPFGRLWWDETMATVVTYPNCHSQVVLHPEQDRLLTVRECARLQGFPDNYRFCGAVKKRYRQVGNAVAIPVAKALGYALGMAFQKLIVKEPLMMLPPKFAYSNGL